MIRRFPTIGRRVLFRRATHGLPETHSNLEWLVLEGGGPIADLWLREAQGRDLLVRQISRARFFRPSDQEDRSRSKSSAGALGRRMIERRRSRPRACRPRMRDGIGLMGGCGIRPVGRGTRP